MDNPNEQLDKAFGTKWAARSTLLRELLKRASSGRQAGSRKKSLRTPAGQLTPEQLTVIAVLDSYGYGVAVKEITKEIELPHANITRTLDKLEKKGLISRTQDRADRRRAIVRLTLEGNKTARRLADVRRRLYASIWDIYNDNEKQLLYDLLVRH
jgi:DNA-binding MarR family transcriptional regulator